jgi:hypothetical protein
MGMSDKGDNKIARHFFKMAGKSLVPIEYQVPA